jgi:hypothetical protein
VLAEWAASALSKSTERGTSGSHHASEDPSDDDSLLIDSGLTQRILTSPAVLLFAALTVIALVAGRSLLSGGPLGGGALTPAAGGASGLWHTYLQSFHPLGTGSATTAPPYLAVVAALATVLGGKPWLAVDVLLLGCVPLAGMTAYYAARRVTRSALARVWAAAAYALLPVALGAVAGGRIGTAAVVILLPLVALAAARIFTQPPKLARRAAWAAGLGVAVCAAFVPLIWVIAVAAAVVAAVTIGRNRGSLINLGITAVVPPVLLFPWTIRVVTQPALLLLEAGIQAPGLATPGLPARSLVLLSPGGPGVPAYWVTGGILVAALAALLAGRSRRVILAGWGAALVGLAAAVAVSRAVVAAPGATVRLPAWPGPALAVAAIGLLVAALSAADGVPGLLHRDPGVSSWKRGLGRVPVVGLLLVACSAPILAAAFWVTNGAGGPLTVVRQQVVPELVAVSSTNGLRLRTLVLRADDGHISYTVLRGAGPSLGEPDLAPDPVTGQALDRAVATLVAPSGGDAADQAAGLAAFDIGYVLMPSPVNADLARLMDGVAGLRPVSSPPASGSTPAFELWRLAQTPARVRVVQPDGTITALPSGRLGVNGATAPQAGGTLELAEPSGGWNASLNGHALIAVPSPAGAWAQAFRLPPGGGTIIISRPGTERDAALLVELLLLIVVGTLALPGIGAGAAAPAAARGRRPEAAPEASAPGPAVPARRVPALAGARVGGRAAASGATTSAGTASAGTVPSGTGPAGAAATGAVDPAAVAGTAVIGAAAAGGRAAAKGRGRGKGRPGLPGRRAGRGRGDGRGAAPDTPDAAPQGQRGRRGSVPSQPGQPGAGPDGAPGQPGSHRGQPAPAGAGAWAAPPRAAAWPDNQQGAGAAGYSPRGNPEQAGPDYGPHGREAGAGRGQQGPGTSAPGYPDYGIEYGPGQSQPPRGRRAAGPRPGEPVPGQPSPSQYGPGQYGQAQHGPGQQGPGGQPGYDTGGQPRYRPDGNYGYDPGYPAGAQHGPGGHGAPPPGYRQGTAYQPGYEPAGQSAYQPGYEPAGYRDPSGGYPEGRRSGSHSRPPGYPPPGGGSPPGQPDESRWSEDGPWSSDSWRTGDGRGQDSGWPAGSRDHDRDQGWDPPSPSGRPPAPASPSAWPDTPTQAWPGGDQEATSHWPAADEDNGDDRW